MYEKILQKLKVQRGNTSNVSDRSLEDMAKTLATIILNDQVLEAADFSAAIASIDGNINHYTAEQVKKMKEADAAAKKKEKEDAERKAAEDAAKKAAEKAKTEGTETPEWVKLLMEQNKAIVDEVNSIKKEKVLTSRADILKKSLEGMPEYFTKPIINNFTRLNFDSDDEFVTYKSEVEKQRDVFVQAMKEQGLNTFLPKKEVVVPETDKELSPVFKKAFENFDSNQQKTEK